MIQINQEHFKYFKTLFSYSIPTYSLFENEQKDTLEIPFKYGLRERAGIDGWWFIPRNTTSLRSGVCGFNIEFH